MTLFIIQGLTISVASIGLAVWIIYSLGLKSSTPIEEEPADDPAKFVEMEDPLDSLNI